MPDVPCLPPMTFLRLRRPLFLASLLVAGLLSGASTRAALDLNADGIPDVWALVFQSGSLPPANDADGDGQSNASEAVAGTDPFRSDSRVRIDDLVYDGAELHLLCVTERGKRYQLQSSSSLNSPIWQNEGTAVVAQYAGTTFTVSATGAAEKFFRVVVDDTDSDNDGVNDWEEIQLGFDPNNSHSGGLTGPDDLTAITTALQAANVVSVSAIDPSATEPALGAPPLETGTFLITRSGNLNAITVTYGVGGGAIPGADYTPLSGSVTLGVGVKSATITVTPLPDTVVESTESVVLTVLPGASYNVGAPAVAAVLINDNIAPNPPGTGGLRAQFWNNTSATVPNFVNTLALTRIDTTVNWDWPASPGTGVNADYFATRWTGEVLPAYAQIYTFKIESNLAGRLWVNGQLIVNNWPPNTVDTVNKVTGTINLQAGVRYPLVFEQYDTTGAAKAKLYWQSANQAEEIIPQQRLFPDTAPQILGSLDVLLIKDSGPYAYQIVASGVPTSYTAANLPNGWTINTTTGIISGTPTQAGTWEIPISASNSSGTGAAILELNVIGTAGVIARDVWENVAGATVADIPLATAPTTSTTLSTLEVPQNTAQNLGERLRGYITAPLTGVYQFWLAADDAAELRISDDDEPVNAWKRAAVPALVGYRDWVAAAKSPLLFLQAGRRYYVEVLHKQSTVSSHVSIGWLKPGESGAVPSEIVPGYTLSPYFPPASVSGETTLYTTNMIAQGAATTGGFGSASLQVSADETQAILSYSYANLSSPVTGAHIHADPWNGKPTQIIFDIDAAAPQQDGSYVWDIAAAGALSAAEIVQVIKDSAAYLNIHTANYPSGEIRGNFRQQAASQNFTAPPPPPNAAPTAAATDAEAARFLIQATYGPSPAEISALRGLSSYETWIDGEFLKPPTHHLDYVEANKNRTDPNSNTYTSALTFNAWWKNSITAPDQLRQRVAFALSEIMVVSESGVLDERGNALSSFYDTLLDGAFGNFRDILEAVTLTPAMGLYLDMRKNDKPDPATGRIPNENYAREVQQLFSIGLNRLHPDGSLILNSKGQPIPTYDQDVIMGFAHVFTGWNYNQPNVGSRLPTNWNNVASDYVNPIKLVPTHHDLGQKRILNNVVLPAATITNPSDPAYDNNGLNDLDAALDALFNHPNTGPFICRQLIQRLVTSTPSRGYLYRAAQKFNDNGAGVRGDMKAVIKAILLDYEARDATLLAQQGYGKQREPLLRVTGAARAFPPPGAISGSYVQNGATIAVTTSSAHRLANNTSAFLTFTTGSPSSATSGSYTVSGVTATSFNVPAKDVLNGTYSQAATTVSVTTGATNHGLATGNYVYLSFTSGGATSGLYPVTVVDGSHLTITAPDSATRASSPCLLVFYKGGYTQSGTTITITTTANHGLVTGNNVYLDFSPVTGSTSNATDGMYTVTVLNELQFTVTHATTATRSGTVVTGPSTGIINRSGSIDLSFGNWRIDITDTDLAQTPLRAPTVFNFFEPNYQFPGTLAAAGLITPEFQLSSDTNVIRQANFLYNGIFNPTGGTVIYSSFRSGANNILLDFTPWMGTAPGATTPWTNTENLSALIDKLNELLLAGQLPGAARTIIQNYVSNLANIAYTNSNPTDAQKRDRLRAIVHLITTSPEFTIQK